MNKKNHSDIDEMVDDAFEHLDYMEFDEALAIGRKLIKKGRFEGYEIAAEALNGLEKRGEAIAILKEGVAKFPDVWSLYDALGVFLSDDDKFQEAHEALAKALACRDAEKSQVRYNDALVYLRQKEYDKALSLCAGITDKKHFLMASALRLEVYEKQGRFDEIINDAIAIIDRYDATEENAMDLGAVHSTLARAFLSKGERKKAEKHVEYAINIDDRCEKALDLRRELAGARSEKSRYYFVSVSGEWPQAAEGEETAPSFYREYDVIAESREEALSFIREFERREVRESITLREAVDDGPCVDEFKGVMWVSGYMFFDEDGADEEA